MNAQRTDTDLVEISAIRLDGDTQSRAQTDPATVAEYAELYRQGVGLPPVVLYCDGVDWWCADGHHRVEAAALAELEEIEAFVYEGGADLAALHSCGANQSHGLRRSPEDKRRAALRCMKLRPRWSDRKVAEHCGISDKTVADERRRAGAEIPQVTEREGRDGKLYPSKPATNPATEAFLSEPLAPPSSAPRSTEVPAPAQRNAAADAELIVGALHLVCGRAGVVPGDLVSADLVWDAWLTRMGIEDRRDNNGWINGWWEAALEEGHARGLFHSKGEQMALPRARASDAAGSLQPQQPSSPVEHPITKDELLPVIEAELDAWNGEKPMPISLLRNRVAQRLKRSIREQPFMAAIFEGRSKGLWCEKSTLQAGVLVGDIWLPEPDSDGDGQEPDTDTDAARKARAEADAPVLLQAIEAVEGARGKRRGELVAIGEVRESMAYLLGIDALSLERWRGAELVAFGACQVRLDGSWIARVVPAAPSAPSPAVAVPGPELDLEEQAERDATAMLELLQGRVATSLPMLRHDLSAVLEERGQLEAGEKYSDARWRAAIDYGCVEEWWLYQNDGLEVLVEDEDGDEPSSAHQVLEGKGESAGQVAAVRPLPVQRGDVDEVRLLVLVTGAVRGDHYRDVDRTTTRLENLGRLAAARGYCPLLPHLSAAADVYGPYDIYRPATTAAATMAVVRACSVSLATAAGQLGGGLWELQPDDPSVESAEVEAECKAFEAAHPGSSRPHSLRMTWKGWRSHFEREGLLDLWEGQ
jgi:hypothetical protein